MLRVACPLQDGVELSRFLSKTGGHATLSTTEYRMTHRLAVRYDRFAQSIGAIVMEVPRWHYARSLPKDPTRTSDASGRTSVSGLPD